MPAVLFVGASISQVAAMRQARAAGWRVVAVDGDPEAVGFAVADVAAPIDFSDVDAVVEFARANAVDAVVAISSDRAVPPAAAVAERLGLPGIDPETAVCMTDKAAMRRRLEAAGVPQARFAIVDRSSDLRDTEDLLPAVVKPVDSGGQRGVYLVHTLLELSHRLPEALAHSSSRRAIVEQYIEGRELNGIIVVRAGEPRLITLSDRLRPPNRGFGVGWIHLYPSSLPASALAAAEDVALTAVRALGLRDGIAFPQLLVTDDGKPYVVEVACRIPAGQMADLVRLGVGVDLIDIAFRQALGETIPDSALEARDQRPIAIRFLTASPGVLPTGEVVSVDGLDDVRTCEGVLQADVYIQVGEVIRPVQVDLDRRGYVIATGADPQEALQRANNAAKKFRVETTLVLAESGIERR